MNSVVKIVQDDKSILWRVYLNDEKIGSLFLTIEPRWYFMSGYYDKSIEWMGADGLRMIADKLDELNNVQKEE